MFYRNLFLLLNLLGVFSNGLWAQNIPSFIPTKIKYEFVLKAETTREGGWQQIQLYMDNEAGGWSLAGSDIYWFPSEDCDDIDYDVKNCTSTIRNNLVINWGGLMVKSMLS